MYTIPDDGCNLYTGMLFLIPGYGGNLDSNVYRHIREDFSDKYNLTVVQCEYFGSAFMQDETPDIVEKLDHNEHIEAMDIITTTLHVLENVETVNTNRIILFGQSHGAYLAHLSNIICPHLFSYIIDISGYITPYYLDRTRVVGYELGRNKLIDVFYTYQITKRKDMRYNEKLYNLSYLYQIMVVD